MGQRGKRHLCQHVAVYTRASASENGRDAWNQKLLPKKKPYVICLNSIRMSCYIEMHEDSSKGGSLLSTSFNSSTANVSHRLNGQSQTKNVTKKDYLCVTIPPTPYSHSQTER